MTETEIERLRQSVPDDMIPLPPGMLACEGCGIATEGEAVVKVESPFNPKFAGQEFTRCPDCQQVYDAASGDVDAHPALVGRFGTVVNDHIITLLLAYRLLGQMPPDDLAFVMPRMLAVAKRVWFKNPMELRDGCSPAPVQPRGRRCPGRPASRSWQRDDGGDVATRPPAAVRRSPHLPRVLDSDRG